MNEIMNRLMNLIPDGDTWDADRSMIFSNVEEYIEELEEKAALSDTYTHSIPLTGDRIVESGEGIPFSWETLAEVFSAALLKEGHMMESEEVFQVDISESGINLIVRERK